MADAQGDSKETGFIGTETETFDTRYVVLRVSLVRSSAQCFSISEIVMT